MQQHPPGDGASHWLIYAAAAALIVIGAKCWMIGHYGNPTPFWDQWDDEGALLFPKYFGGTLKLSDLLSTHNEHRLFFTRVWLLLLLALEGYWDPIVQMLANTLIVGALVVLLVGAIRPLLPYASLIVFVLFATLVFALPWTWGNTLDGFNCQYYFLLLFSIAGIVSIVGAQAFAPRWWIAALFLLCGYFSSAGGATAAAAAFSIGVVQMAVGARRGVKETLALAVLAAATVAMVLEVPVLPYQTLYRAHSVGQFLQASIEILSWPAATGMTFIPTLIVLAVVSYAPAWLASVQVISLRPALSDRRWRLVALTGWLMLQVASVAYARAVVSITARYLDLYSIGLLVNAACLLYLLDVYPAVWRRRRLVTAAIAVWLVPVLVGITLTVVKHTARDLVAAREHAKAETENLRSYLATGNIGALQNKAELDIPYGDANRLAMIVSQPLIRAVLPPALVGAASAERAQQRGLASYTGHAVVALKNAALRWGVLLIPFGLALFAVGLVADWRRKVKPALR